MIWKANVIKNQQNIHKFNVEKVSEKWESGVINGIPLKQ